MSNIKKGSKLTVSTANGISRATTTSLGVLEVSGPKMSDVTNAYDSNPAHFVVGATDVSGILQVGINNDGNTFIDASVDNNHKDIILQKYGGNTIFGSGSNSTAKVGIGTTSPNGTLNVYKSGNGEGMVQFTSTSDMSMRLQSDRTGLSSYDMEVYYEIIPGTTTTQSWKMGINDDKNLHFAWGDTGTLNSQEKLTILNTGNVGIGTTNPYSKLEIAKGAGNSHIRIAEGSHNNIDNSYLYPVLTYYARQDNIRRDYNNDPFNQRYGVSASISFTDRPGTYTYANKVRTTDIVFHTALNYLPPSVNLGHYPIERMRITAEGNVGIGVTDPSGGKLHVDGNIYSTGKILGEVGGSNLIVGGTTYQSATAPTNGMLVEGNVGIGTTSPYSKLHVNGNITLDACRTGSSYPTGSVGGGISFRAGAAYAPDSSIGAYNCSILTYAHDQTTDGLSINGYDGVSFCTGSSTRNERMRINSSGNVGIGTTSPGAKLHIKGGDLRIERPDTEVPRIELIRNNSSKNFGGDNYQDWAIQNSGGKFQIISGHSTNGDTIVLSSDGTNVGIGTTSPNAPLHIFSKEGEPTNHIKDMIKIETEYNDFDDSNREGGASILFYVENYNGGDGQGFPGEAARIVAGCDELSNANEYHSYLAFHTSNNSSSTGTTEQMVIRHNGNVGIGVANPSYRLVVNTASAETKVQFGTGGNDYGTVMYIGGGSINQRKLALISEPITPIAYCRSDLHFCLNTSNANNDVTLSDSKMVIKNNGNVGIGTTVPKNKLDVEGAAVIGATYSGTNNAPINGLLVEGNVGIGTTDTSQPSNEPRLIVKAGRFGTIAAFKNVNDTIVGTIYASSQGKGAFFLYDDTGTKKFHLSTYDDSYIMGNVGIGTTDPQAKLSIRQSGGSAATPDSGKDFCIYDTDNAGLYIKSGTSTNGSTISYGLSYYNGSSTVDVDNALVLRNYSGTNSVGIGTTDPGSAYKLNVNGNTKLQQTYVSKIIHHEHSGTGIWFDTADSLRFIINNKQRMIFDDNGRLGIGHNMGYTPSCMLDISCNLDTTGINVKGAGTENNGKFQFILRAEGPDDSTQRVVHFLNSSTRTDDGGANTYTIRNDYGNLRLGNASYDTIINGNVGIGTTDPNERLHVIGNAVFQKPSSSTDYTSNSTHGINLIPHGGDSGGNAGGRIFFDETVNGNQNYGFSLGYNGGADSAILNWKTDTFNINRHDANAIGATVLSISRASSHFKLNATTTIGADDEGEGFLINLGSTGTVKGGTAGASYRHGYLLGDGNKNIVLLNQEDGMIRIGSGNVSNGICIDTNNNVGIGTTNPEAPLHIKFTQPLTIDPTNNIKDMIKIETEYSDDFGGSYREGGSSILFYVENTNNQGLPGEAARIVAGCYETSSSSEAHSYLAFHTSNNSSAIGTNERMIIDDNGYVGIGTTNPRTKLHISKGVNDSWTTGTTAADCHMLIGGNEWGTSGTNKALKIGLGYFDKASANVPMYIGSRIITSADDTTSALVFGTRNSHLDTTAAEERMCILPNGNVGIGTTNPAEKLQVEGNITTSTGYPYYQSLGTENIVNPPSTARTVHGVNITAMNKRTRASYASAEACVETWTARSSASEANVWLSVCWSPELSIFAAVAGGGTNRVMTSPDGITWTARSASEANGWYSVCWSPELSIFVAVAYTGTNNRVMTSPDGITWTARSASEANGWDSVCWSPELSIFVAVAYYGTNRVMTSPDGITWTARSASEANTWYSVCWSPELSIFAAVASSGTNRVMTSNIGMPNSKSVVKALPTQMSVLPNGKVGIGATDPTDFLTVRHPATTSPTWRGIGLEDNNGSIRHRIALAGASGTADCYSIWYSQYGNNTCQIHADGQSHIVHGLKVGADGSSSYDFEVVGTAKVTSGSWSASDDRVKHNETAVENAIETIKKLEVKKYFKSEKIYDRNHHYELDGSGNPITDDKYVEECGIIAQQIKTIPELAFCVNGEEEIEETVIDYKDGSEEIVIKQTPLGVNYTNLFCYNIQAVQDLIKKVELLEQQLQALQSHETTIQQQATTIQQQATKITTLETQIADILSRLSVLENN